MTRIAIVGTGPSGLYLGKYLSNLIKGSRIDFFEKSHRLFGLFRYGIAPDRLSLKTSGYSLVSNKYRFFTGVEVGTTLRVEKLLKFYKFVFLCCGSGNSKRLPIKNEKFGVFDALDVVKYYNKGSEQDYLSKIPSDLKIYQVDSSTTDNTLEEAVEKHLGHLTQLREVEIGIIGNGNVALDIVRAFCGFKGEEVGIAEQQVTSGESPANLGQVGNTDKALPVNPAFLELVGKLNIKRITLFGRSSLPESKFTNPELRELLHFPNWYTVSSGCLNRLESLSGTPDTTSRAVRRKIELFKALTGSSKATDQPSFTQTQSGSSDRSSTTDRPIQVDFKFNTRVVSVENDSLGNIVQVVFQTTNPEIGNISGPDTTSSSTTIDTSDSTKLLNSPTDTHTDKEDSHHQSAVDRRACHLLIKCIGFEPTPVAQQLLRHVDNKRVFANGWLTSAGRGDLNSAITSSLQLAKYVQHLSASAAEPVDSNLSSEGVLAPFSSSSCGSPTSSPEGPLDSADILSYLQSKHTIRAH